MKETMRYIEHKQRFNKKTLFTFACVLCAVLLIGGSLTYFYASSSTNAFAAVAVNAGGRLHDDFDGQNKDVYVENFTKEAEGGEPIYARIRLDEYMELGEDAGKNKKDKNRRAVSVIKGADINDPSTWKTHIPNDDNDVFHTYWTWKLGGSTKYMPTFNKNKDSLQADINGTYEGIKQDDDIHYDDHINYSDPKHASKTAKAVYDADDNTNDEGASAIEGVNITYKEETHIVKRTQTAEVITMEEWITKGHPIGTYWVYDKDGWAYWANPIQPEEATGLLLDGIELKHAIHENYYYAINVVAQFVTKDDWGSENGGGFFMNGEEPSEEAMTLLETIVKK